MAYEQKIEGSVCSDCGVGKNVKNPKTGKIFCDKKCWLNNSQPKSAPSYQPQSASADKQPVNWDKVNAEKENSMRWMNALNNATSLIANREDIFKDIKTDKLVPTIEALARAIHKIEAPLKVKVEEANWSQPSPPEDVPTINADDDINVDDIPF